MDLTVKQCDSYWVRIYIAGPIEQAKQIIRRECMKEGLCVTITPTDYIYTGGEEAGAVVELINYARFPKSKEQLWDRAVELGETLRTETYQHSATVMSPERSLWFTSRKEQ